MAAQPNRDWEAVFTIWGAAPSQTQQDKAENAVRAVRNAIDASTALSAHSIDVFVQGSYRNRTNVRQDSDVDVSVCYRDAWFVSNGMDAPTDDGIDVPEWKCH